MCDAILARCKECSRCREHVLLEVNTTVGELLEGSLGLDGGGLSGVLIKQSAF